MGKRDWFKDGVLTVALVAGMTLAAGIGFALGQEYPTERSIHVSQFRCCHERNTLKVALGECRDTSDTTSSVDP